MQVLAYAVHYHTRLYPKAIEINQHTKNFNKTLSKSIEQECQFRKTQKLHHTREVMPRPPEPKVTNQARLKIWDYIEISRNKSCRFLFSQILLIESLVFVGIMKQSLPNSNLKLFLQFSLWWLQLSFTITKNFTN